MVNIQSPTAEIRQGNKKGERKKKERKKKERNRIKIYWSALLHRATIMIRAIARKTGPLAYTSSLEL